MGYLVGLASTFGPRLGNLSFGAQCSKFGRTWHHTTLHKTTAQNISGFGIYCHSSSAARVVAGDQLLSERRTVSKNAVDLARRSNSASSRVLHYADFHCYASSLESLVRLRNKSVHFQHQKLIHTSSVSFLREDSKVEETLEALKDTIKESSATNAKAAIESASSATTTVAPVTLAPVAVKKPLRERIVAELKHYYHGFRLLFIDVKVCARLIWQVLHGQSLTRREQKQLVRTTADMFRLVPFLVIILIPFAEFALPVLLKVFPGMLPSTFKEEHRELEKRRQRLKMKLEMAKFLQDTLEETSLERKGGTGESAHNFAEFIGKIRTSGVQASNEDILRYSQLFEDEITLDNLSSDQLRAICRLVEVPAVGTSYFLRFQIEMKLRQLQADDILIQKEGVDSMAVWELQEACRQRGMRSFGVPEQRLRSQLTQWLDLHLKNKVPTSLLLLSRTLYLPEHLSAEDQLRATLSALPAETMAEEAKVKILEMTGDRVDNKSKLEVIKQEEEIIQQEKKELQKEELAKKLKAAVQKPAPAVGLQQEQLVDKAPVLGLQDDIERITEIDAEDLGKIEDILEHVIASKDELQKEVEELEALKEDLTEYQEKLEDVREVVQQSGGALPGLSESKAAQRLSRKVSKMIEQMDEVVNELTSQKKSLMADIKAEEGIATGQQVNDAREQILEQISVKQNNLIHINELLDAINKLQHVPDGAKFEAIAKVLDEDKDGLIDYKEAIKVVELLGKDNIKLSPTQMTEIMSVLRKEKAMLDLEKQQKLEERKLQQQQNTSSSASGQSGKI